MPQVPGTKIWVRNQELSSAIEAMDKTNTDKRLLIAEELALETVHRSRQSFESNYGKVHRFICLSWWNHHLEVK